MIRLQLLVTFFLCKRVQAAQFGDIVSGLFSDESCTQLVLLGNETTFGEGEQEVLRNGIAQFVYDANFSVDNVVTSKEASCLIGISMVDQFQVLHDNLMQRYDRRLVIISKNEVSLEKISLHKYHQPALVIQKSQKQLLVKTVCHSGKVHLLNSIRDRWIRSVDEQSFDASDRICNNGHHPLSNNNFKVSVFSSIPFIAFNKEGSKVVDGVAYDMVNTLSEYLKFKWTPIIVLDWAVFQENGTIGGSLGEVLNGRADFCLEMSVMAYATLGRMTRVTYNQFFSYIELAPEQLPVIANILRPFDLATWLALIATNISVAFTFYVLNRFSTNKDGTRSLLESFLMAFGIVFQEYQDGRCINNKQNIKYILRLLWIVLAMLLTLAYSSNLKSNLIKKRFAKRTMTLNEMLDRDMTVHMTEGFFAYVNSTKTLDDLHQRMALQVRKKSSLFQVTTNAIVDAIDILLKEGGATMIYEQSIQSIKGDYFMRGLRMPFVIIPEWYLQSPQAMFFQKYDSRASYFDEPISRMTDCGIIDYFFRKQTPFRDIKQQNIEGTKEEKLVLEHFILPIAFGISGLTAGLFAFLMELKTNLGSARKDQVYLTRPAYQNSTFEPIYMINVSPKAPNPKPYEYSSTI